MPNEGRPVMTDEPMDDGLPENDGPDDPLPALIAGLDQALAIAPQLARVAMGYFTAYKEAGFGDQQALYLAACQLNQSPGKAP
jgi:hypothetical protein